MKSGKVSSWTVGKWSKLIDWSSGKYECHRKAIHKDPSLERRCPSYKEREWMPSGFPSGKKRVFTELMEDSAVASTAGRVTTVATEGYP